MVIALHAGCLRHSNLATDIRAAREAGFDGIELSIPRLARYLDAGFSTEQLDGLLGPLRVTMLDLLLPVESQDPGTRAALRAQCARMAPVAARLGCDALQVVALDGFAGDTWPAQRRVLVDSLTELGQIAQEHGVRVAIEPVSFSRFRTIAQALEVIEAVGAHRAGLVLDTWHLWTSGTSWAEVAAVDPALISCAQIGDTWPKAGLSWSDNDRGALPGEGILPLAEAIDAIRSTGYDGVWSVEMISKQHAEWEPGSLAAAMLERTRQLLGNPLMCGSPAGDQP